MDRIENAQMNSLGTRKLYYENVHQTDFYRCGDGMCSRQGRGILQDRSGRFPLFFPEEGGQSADKGTLNGQEVLDVSIKQGILYHKMTCELPAGTEVTGHVDWNRRFDFMQQHSGEHMISGLLHSHFGLENVGFHLSDREVTLDMNGGSLSGTTGALSNRKPTLTSGKNLPVNISGPPPKNC